MLELSTVLPTRLHPPRLHAYTIERAHLLARLNEAPLRPLTLICAPAGYGKSTLAVQWLTRLTHDGPTAEHRGDSPKIAWLSLDEQDIDLPRFLQYFICAIQVVYPNTMRETMALLDAQDQVPADYLTAVAIQELAQLPMPRLYLVLDDYHAVHEAAIHVFMGKLVRHMPDQLHIVIVTRTDPPLALARMRLQRQVVEIRMRDLRFTTQEASQYLQQTHCPTLSDAEMSMLVHLCEGWAAGIQTAVLSLWDGTPPNVLLRDFSGGQRNILAYLIEEVLANQPTYIYDFLLKTSIVDRFSPALCDALLHDDSLPHEALDQAMATSSSELVTSEMILGYLERENLFLISLDEEHGWYRYHHLFQGVLCEWLTARYEPEKIKQLHRRAANWFRAQGYIDEALDHALMVDPVMAAEIVELYTQEMMNRSEMRTLALWLQRLPLESKNTRPRLLVAQACIEVIRGRYSAITGLLDQAEQIMAQNSNIFDDDTAAQIRVEIMVLRVVAGYHGDEPPAQVLDQAKILMDVFAGQEQKYPWLAGNAAIYWAGSSMRLGYLHETIGTLRQRLDQLTASQNEYALRLYQTVCYLYQTDYDLIQLEQAARRILHGLRQSEGDLLRGWGHWFLAFTLYERGKLDEALVNAQAATALRYRTHGLCIMSAWLVQALVHSAYGETEVAQADLDAAQAFVEDSAMLRSLPQVTSTRLRVALTSRTAFPHNDLMPPPSPHFNHSYSTTADIPQLTYARWLLRQGTPERLAEAEARLDTLLIEARQQTAHRQIIPALAILSLIYVQQERASDAYDTLEAALELAQPRGLVSIFVELGSEMAALLRQCRTRSAHQGYIDTLLTAFPPDASDVEPTDSISQQTQLAEPLTDRELEVLNLLVARHSYREIATELVISPKTVKKHVSNIYGKLGVGRRHEAIRMARDQLLLP